MEAVPRELPGVQVRNRTSPECVGVPELKRERGSHQRQARLARLMPWTSFNTRPIVLRANSHFAAKLEFAILTGRRLQQTLKCELLHIWRMAHRLSLLLHKSGCALRVIQITTEEEE